MEYSINVEKLQAMKRDDISKNIFSTLVHYSLLALVLGLFLSSLLFIPTLCSSSKLFLLDTLPKMIGVVSSPRCLFVVFNLIIIFLVGESRLTRSSKLDIYEEYVVHNQMLKGLPSDEIKVEESVADIIPLGEEKKEEVVEENIVVESPLVEEKEEEEEVMKEEMVGSVEEEEQEKELSAEELNIRVEAFIAMVNMQMRLEARNMVVCCG